VRPASAQSAAHSWRIVQRFAILRAGRVFAIEHGLDAEWTACSNDVSCRLFTSPICADAFAITSRRTCPGPSRQARAGDAVAELDRRLAVIASARDVNVFLRMRGRTVSASLSTANR